MKCPRDGTELAKVELDQLGIELDKCHKCDGIWCDRSEFLRLRDSRLVEVEETLEVKYGDPEFVEGQTEGHMLCPTCDGGRLARHSGRAGIGRRLPRLARAPVDRVDRRGLLTSNVGRSRAVDLDDEAGVGAEEACVA